MPRTNESNVTEPNYSATRAVWRPIIASAVALSSTYAFLLTHHKGGEHYEELWLFLLAWLVALTCAVLTIVAATRLNVRIRAGTEANTTKNRVAVICGGVWGASICLLVVAALVHNVFSR